MWAAARHGAVFWHSSHVMPPVKNSALHFSNPPSGGKSRPGTPVHNIQKTALINKRSSAEGHPASPAPRGRCDSNHTRSVPDMACRRYDVVSSIFHGVIQSISIHRLMSLVTLSNCFIKFCLFFHRPSGYSHEYHHRL